jgi:hypothetical protein
MEFISENNSYLEGCNKDRENRQVVTDEPVEFEKWPVEVQDCRKIIDHFRGIDGLYPNLIKENGRMSTCNRLDLQTLGSQPIMPKNLPDHWVAMTLWTYSGHLDKVQECVAEEVVPYLILNERPHVSNIHLMFIGAWLPMYVYTRLRTNL